MNYLDCDIVLLSNNTTTQETYSLSKKLEAHDTLFTLKDGVCFPHSSLYIVRLEESHLARVGAVLAEIASHTPPIDLVASDYHQQWGYIDVEYVRNQIIDRFQMTVVDAINPLRAGLREKDQVRLETAEGEERENIERYGYRSIGELFAPHVTLTRFKAVDPIDITDLPNIHSFDATFEKVALFEMGDNGTCVRKIVEFDLTR